MTPPQDTIAPAGRADSLKRIVVGRPMATDELEDTLLPKTLALPIFASDPLSSVAYATESAMVVLVAVSASALHLAFPLSLGIAALLAIVVLSYRQTVRAYETSGGAYVVAKENLGTLSSLVAAGALLTDYVLTVAVSVAAGIFAITSIAPALEPHKVALSLGCVVLIALANLRGVRESGLLFALPTYAFVTAMFVLVGTGIARCAAGSCPTATVPHPLPAGTTGAVTLFVLLRAFASGSTALTGVEAIANGVNAFRHPQGRNAAKTLGVLGAIAIALFVGVSFLAVQMHARPSATVSVVSQVARATFPAGSGAAFMYYAVQGLTLLVLVLAANTSFQGFPRLAALLARDGYFARQFTNLGDRLVFSNGILVLTVAASLLLWIYGASVDSLIHLYVIGVFTAFTLSQAGMVRYWFRRRERGWQRSALVNAIGATATGLVTVIVIVTKFAQGAWLVIVAIPLLVLAFYGVHRHYRRIGRRLRAGIDAVRAVTSKTTNTTVLYVESLDEATDEAVWYARLVAGDETRAIHVPGPHTDSGIRARWFSRMGERPRLEILTPETSRADAAMEYVWTLPRGEADFVTVVIPELFRRRSLADALRRRVPFSLKLRLLYESGVAITDVPVVAGAQEGLPKRVAARIFVSGVHAATLRALNYARTLGLPDTRAVYFAFSEEEAERMKRDWLDAGLQTPLEVVEAQFRDIGTPLLAYLRELTADPDVAVAAVMPEIVVRGWSRLLHNQRALYVKRLLLFEPRVILTSVPYQLFR
jgi:amino acid transporter